MNKHKIAKGWYVDSHLACVSLFSINGILLEKYMSTGLALLGVLLLSFVWGSIQMSDFEKKYGENFADNNTTTGDKE